MYGRRHVVSEFESTLLHPTQSHYGRLCNKKHCIVMTSTVFQESKKVSQGGSHKVNDIEWAPTGWQVASSFRLCVLRDKDVTGAGARLQCKYQGKHVECSLNIHLYLRS